MVLHPAEDETPSKTGVRRERRREQPGVPMGRPDAHPPQARPRRHAAAARPGVHRMGEALQK
eukprot:5032577-Heterocapsa_arctica.AAC.1